MRRRFLVTMAAALAVGLAPGAAAARRRPAAHPLADRVVCIKHARRLYLYRGEAVIASYRVALGRYPKGPKVAEGDSRTPEGRYVLDYRLDRDRSNFHRALHVSYPNEADRARARALGVDPGGRIMIHGLPIGWSERTLGHPGFDWTAGCIAVRNHEIDEIWDMVADGTPIDILP